jgi:glycosyltransferase involved in cell wall biosynthesis
VTRAPELSVVISTWNRPLALSRLLQSLRAQEIDRSTFEILVVDDGSQPPIVVNARAGERIRVLRREHGERSTARNHGASQATGPVLLFLDDDLLLSPGLAAAHLVAHRQWEGCLAVGAIRLPDDLARTSFGAFRQALEMQGIPMTRGPVQQRNFCTAGNMSIRRDHFLSLGGFDPTLVSAEDQDLALRHSASGGTIVHLPEALAIHNDENADLRSYCRRAEWGAEHMAAFCQRHPDLQDNVDRLTVNGPVRWSDPASLLFKKTAKDVLGQKLAIEGLLAAVAAIERRRPASRLLPRLYKLLLGIHLQKGFRRGWRAAPPSQVIP